MTTTSPLANVIFNMRLKPYISSYTARKTLTFVLGLVLMFTFAVTGVQAFDCGGVQSCACCKMETMGHSPMATPGTHTCDWPAMSKSASCDFERPVSSPQSLFLISSDRHFLSDFSNFIVDQQADDTKALVARNINLHNVAVAVIPEAPIYLQYKSFRC